MRPRRYASDVAHMASHAEFVVETEGLTKRFGDRVAVADVDLRVPAGCAFGCLGPNGAGKTTLLRMVLGLTRPSSGEARLLGHPMPAGRAEALARVGAIIEEPLPPLPHGPGKPQHRCRRARASRAHADRWRLGACWSRESRRRAREGLLLGHAPAARRRALILSPLLARLTFLGAGRDVFPGGALDRLVPHALVETPHDDGWPAMSAGAAVLVLVLWICVSLAVGAWRTSTRDAY